MRTITIEVTYSAEYLITDAEFDLVHYLYNLSEPKKVTAVKFIKNQHNLSLKIAKDICDKIGHNPIQY